MYLLAVSLYCNFIFILSVYVSKQHVCVRVEGSYRIRIDQQESKLLEASYWLIAEQINYVQYKLNLLSLWP